MIGFLDNKKNVHELLGHLLGRYEVGQFWGEMMTQHIAYDSSEQQRFLSLSIPVPGKQPCALQDLVNAWWEQELNDGHRCIFLSLPSVLVIHLQRFRYLNGGVSRNNTAIALTPLQFPHDAVEIVGQRIFHPRAVILHHGASPRSGHYTCYLLRRAGAGWYMDDAQLPQDMTSDATLVARQSYLVMLQSDT